MSTAICITGMHRSGTSLTASWLERCGLPIHDGSLIAPAEGNLRGHFEDREMVMLHSAALEGQALGGSVGWAVKADTPVAFDPAQREEAEALVRRREEKFGTWGWKDPRTVLFLDEWTTLVPDLKVLLVWRPADEVVDSLVRRSRRTKNPDMKARILHAARLWKVYNQRLLDYRRRHMTSTVLLPFVNLIDADKWVLDLVTERFEVELAYTPISELYRPDARKKRRLSVARALSGMATRVHNCAHLEQELRQASDGTGG